VIRLISENFGGIVFLLLYPGFFIYNFLVGSGVISAVFGGYFGIVSSLVAPPLIAIFLLRLRVFPPPSVIIFLVAILFNIIVIVFNLALDRPNASAMPMFVWSMTGILFSLVGFFMGCSLKFTTGLEWSNFAALCILLAIAVLNIDDFGALSFKSASEVSDGVLASHQGLARSVLLCGILATAFAIKRNIFFFYFVFLAALVTLFLTAARTEFVVYSLACLVSAAMFYGVSLRVLWGSVFFICLASVSVVTFTELLPDSRINELTDISQASSFIARQKLQEAGFMEIARYPMFGHYGGYVQSDGLGGYPHNLISAWVNLGLPGFLLYVSAIAAICVGLFRSRYSDDRSVSSFFLSAVVVAAVAGVIFSKNYNYELLAIGFGLVGANSLKPRLGWRSRSQAD